MYPQLINNLVFVAKGTRPCNKKDCAEICKEPGAASSKYVLGWWWLMNILIVAHVFNSFILSPLMMPSPSICFALSPGVSSSECHSRIPSSHFSTMNKSKDVRWKEDNLNVKMTTCVSSAKESSQRWSVYLLTSHCCAVELNSYIVVFARKTINFCVTNYDKYSRTSLKNGVILICILRRAKN